MKNSLIYNWLPMLFSVMATFSFTACGDGDDTDYAALSAMQATTDSRAVDLGLSVKWASCNVGATTPEGYGGYYAWGEIEEKNDYDWVTYKYCNGDGYSMTKYCIDSRYGTVDNKTTLEPTDDVATVKWGGAWRMPTLDEIKELIDNCKCISTTLNGVNGYHIIGPNGNCLFLPATGDGISQGNYWSSSLSRHFGLEAYHLIIDNHSLSLCDEYDRKNGRSIRPVCP